MKIRLVVRNSAGDQLAMLISHDRDAPNAAATLAHNVLGLQRDQAGVLNFEDPVTITFEPAEAPAKPEGHPKGEPK